MKFLSFDSPFFQFMEKVADFFIVNILTVILLLPIVTGGAALTAAHKIMQNYVTKNDQPVFKTYFRTFASEFKHSTIVWLLSLVLIAILALNVTLVFFNFSGNLAFLLYILLGIATVVFLGTAAYAIPMIARYENSLKQHLRNALLLAVGNLPKTVIMLALYAIPVLLAFLDVEIFFNLIFFWLLIGTSLTIYLETKLLYPIFQKLEDAAEDSEADDSAE